MTSSTRKPRIALMGEFSAGKSTLSNLLLGARPLPEKVTATRLSPVWMSAGTDAPYRVDVDGTEEPVAIDELESIPVEETRVIRLFFEADILELCDLIDFPGISDPNMSAEVWQRMVSEVDAVLWCTHATQAWRQSEAAAWETIPEHVRARSALLITRFDKLTNDRDKYRVLTRVNKETTGLFDATFPISLTEALAAGDDFDAFQSSGGGALLEYLLPLIERLSAEIADTPTARPAAMPIADASPAPDTDGISDTPRADLAAKLEGAAFDPDESEDLELAVEDEPEVAVPAEPVVVPRRVRLSGGGLRSKRPARPSPTGLVHEMARENAPGPAKAAAAGDLRSIFHGGDDNDVAKSR